MKDREQFFAMITVILLIWGLLLVIGMLST